MTGPEPDDVTQRLTVAAGEEFSVAATDLVSGGYRWTVRVPDGLTLLAEESDSRRHTFRLRAVRPGDHLLMLRLVRSWEPPETPPAQQRQIVVHVAPPPGRTQ